MSTLTVLDWPRLLNTPDTRWYLVPEPDDWDVLTQCTWAVDCHDTVVAYVDYQVCELPDDTPDLDFLDCEELVCSKHLAALIADATGEPLVAGTVVEVGVDPALLRLTGVDPAVVARFNDGAIGVAA